MNNGSLKVLISYLNWKQKMTDQSGGYCPMCDILYGCAPGKCNCEPDTFGKSGMKLGESVGMNERRVLASIDEVTNYEVSIWNAAIEAAANKATELGGVSYVDDEIRKLKK